MAKSKKIKVVAEKQESDDETIFRGLSNVREGILSGEWDLVCEGYNLITEDNLEPPDKPKLSKLERIRAKLKSESTEEENDEEINEETEDVQDGGMIIKTVERPDNARFGAGKLEIISSPINKKQQIQNQKHAAAKPRITKPRINPLSHIPTPKDDPTNQASIRIYDKPPEVARKDRAN